MQYRRVMKVVGRGVGQLVSEGKKDSAVRQLLNSGTAALHIRIGKQRSDLQGQCMLLVHLSSTFALALFDL